ncbi:homocysteine S-methyltransferase [Elysia marginata]|uniref:Homocysteine S-methyltransferase n=1 Tax=Elysia marginata TaxID=1093978 RepID=A0AAV4I1W6_9GAST|nr:homocysteine S-methyltransferase [Elysia marginata]
MNSAVIQPKRVVILDGGTGTSLANLGHAVEDLTWCSCLIKTHPNDVKKVHKDYFLAGADVVVTATYQAFVDGFVKQFGVSKEEASEFLKKGVELAKEARDEAEIETGRHGFVAASVGAYGATLCDRSEYTGVYVDNMSIEELSEWHMPRMKTLCEARPDILACETIPALAEAMALVSCLEKLQEKAWLTFQLKLVEVVAAAAAIVVAVLVAVVAAIIAAVVAAAAVEVVVVLVIVVVVTVVAAEVVVVLVVIVLAAVAVVVVVLVNSSSSSSGSSNSSSGITSSICKTHSMKNHFTLSPWVKPDPPCKRDAKTTAYGDDVRVALQAIVSCPFVVAVGANCFSLAVVDDFLSYVQDLPLFGKPLIIKPNAEKSEHDKSLTKPFKIHERVADWAAAGACWIGGCCSTDSTDIGQIRQAMEKDPHSRFIAKGETLV